MTRRSFLVAALVAPFVPRVQPLALGVDMATGVSRTVVVEVFGVTGAPGICRFSFHTRDFSLAAGRFVQSALNGMVEGTTSPPGNVIGVVSSVKDEIPTELHSRIV